MWVLCSNFPFFLCCATGNNYFGCYLSGVYATNRIDIISGKKVLYSLKGEDLQKNPLTRYRKNDFSDAKHELIHVFVNFFCENCQIQRVIFHTSNDRAFHTDHHTIGWYQRKIKHIRLKQKNNLLSVFLVRYVWCLPWLILLSRIDFAQLLESLFLNCYWSPLEAFTCYLTSLTELSLYRSPVLSKTGKCNTYIA